MTYTAIYFRPYGTEQVFCRSYNYAHAKQIYENFVNDYIDHKRYIRFFIEETDVTEEIQKKIKIWKHLI